MASVRLSVLGSTVGVRCDDDCAAELSRLFAPFGTATETDGPVLELHTPDQLTGTVAAINAIALAGAPYFAAHAGVVARDGRTAAFVGPSGAGKTTLTAACLLAGLEYVSDEALCLSWEDAAVWPYPRPLGLSAWTAGALGVPLPAEPPDELLVTAADLGARVAAPPLRLAHLVLLDQDGPTGEPAVLPRSAGVAGLLRRSFTHWHRPQRAFELAHEALAGVRVWSLRPGDPRADATTITSLLS
jgi:hypothetical protein